MNKYVIYVTRSSKILIWERYLAPGPYMCMLNTDPMKSRIGILQVYTNTFIKL